MAPADKSVSAPLGLALLWLSATCATVPPPVPVAALFAAPSGTLPSGACRLAVTYAGGLERLARVNATVAGVDGIPIQGCGYPSQKDCDANLHAFDFGAASLTTGRHRLSVAFQFIGTSWLHKDIVAELTLSQQFECSDGLASVRVTTAASSSFVPSWKETKVSLAWSGSGRAVSAFDDLVVEWLQVDDPVQSKDPVSNQLHDAQLRGSLVP